VVAASSLGASGDSIARRDVARLVLAATCWGLGTVISKAALDEMPPLALLPVQLAASLAILIVAMRLRGVSLRSGGPALLGRLGLLNPGIAYALSLAGLVTVTASLAVLLWALEPLVILFVAAWFLHERITPSLVLLSAIALGGMALVVYDPAMGSAELGGVVLTLAGVGCCAAYTVIARRFIPDAAETSQVILAQQAYALGLTLAVVSLAGLAGGAIAPATLTPLGLASAIASGALYYAGAYWFYLGALRTVPASLAAMAFYLIPIVGVAGGALLLGEWLDVQQWVGAVVVLGALLAVLRQRADQPAESTAPARIGA
jgi:drug/metabolite transporter (DMT)-like permease